MFQAMLESAAYHTFVLHPACDNQHWRNVDWVTRPEIAVHFAAGGRRNPFGFCDAGRLIAPRPAESYCRLVLPTV
jgi:hypothetical protein